VEETSVLELAAQLRDLTCAQIEAVQAGRWEEASAFLQRRGAVLQRLQTIDPGTLDASARAAIAALLEEVRELDAQLVAAVEAALAALRDEQQQIDRNSAAARGYRRALGSGELAEIVDREA